MSAHTPGPWRLSAWEVRATSNGFVLANVTAPDRRARGKEWKEDMDTCMANARLIVAAPDLLAALQALVASLAEHDDEGMVEHAEQMIAARAAITKATGVPP